MVHFHAILHLTAYGALAQQLRIRKAKNNAEKADDTQMQRLILLFAMMLFTIAQVQAQLPSGVTFPNYQLTVSAAAPTVNAQPDGWTHTEKTPDIDNMDNVVTTTANHWRVAPSTLFPASTQKIIIGQFDRFQYFGEGFGMPTGTDVSGLVANRWYRYSVEAAALRVDELEGSPTFDGWYTRAIEVGLYGWNSSFNQWQLLATQVLMVDESSRRINFDFQPSTFVGWTGGQLAIGVTGAWRSFYTAGNLQDQINRSTNFFYADAFYAIAAGSGTFTELGDALQQFSALSFAQTYTVPSGVTHIRVKAWGAGGGGSGTALAGIGGNGGYAEGILPVTPGETLEVLVGGGGGGTSGASPGSGGLGGGGWGGISNGIRYEGGGGRSYVRRGTTELITAGGGGGGGSTGSSTKYGGAGGGLTGGDGSDTPFNDTYGRGGTQSAGGAGGIGSFSGGNGNPGTQFQGGEGGSGGSEPGSGGGGGYFGGGGGGAVDQNGTPPDVSDGPGGGGSSYIGGVSQGFTVSGNILVPGHFGDAIRRNSVFSHDYVGIGFGGDVGSFASSDGFQGKVVFFPASLPAEICTNGIDDDGDGLVDCADSDCGVSEVAPGYHFWNLPANTDYFPSSLIKLSNGDFLTGGEGSTGSSSFGRLRIVDANFNTKNWIDVGSILYPKVHQMGDGGILVYSNIVGSSPAKALLLKLKPDYTLDWKKEAPFQGGVVTPTIDGGITVVSGGIDNFTVFKFNSAGTLQSQTTHAYPNSVFNVSPYDIIQLANGDLLLINLIVDSGGSHGALVRLNSTGSSIIFSQKLPNISQQLILNEGSNGNLYISGRDVTARYAIKLGSNGSLLEIKQFGFSSTEYIYNANLNKAKNGLIMVAGDNTTNSNYIGGSASLLKMLEVSFEPTISLVWGKSYTSLSPQVGGFDVSSLNNGGFLVGVGTVGTNISGVITTSRPGFLVLDDQGNLSGCTLPAFAPTLINATLALTPLTLSSGTFSGTFNTTSAGVLTMPTITLSKGTPSCGVPANIELCTNSIDDDGDGLIDSADPGCACAVTPEICANGIDDDGDGLIDCADPDCVCSAKRGDCNGDGVVNNADLTAISSEIFDGDGTDPKNAGGGTFVGTCGCDANGDNKIDAGDLSCAGQYIADPNSVPNCLVGPCDACQIKDAGVTITCTPPNYSIFCNPTGANLGGRKFNISGDITGSNLSFGSSQQVGTVQSINGSSVFFTIQTTDGKCKLNVTVGNN